MQLNPFPAFPLWANLLLGGIAAALIWFAGTRLERYSEAVARRTGMTKAFLGLLLLATVTSLPELATVGTALLVGNVDLATHNLLGCVIAQTAVLAVADLYLRDGALTRFAPKFVLLIEGVGLVQLLAVAIESISPAGSITLTFNIQERALSIAPGPVALVILFLALLYLSYRSEGQPRWHPRESHQEDEEQEEEEQEQEEENEIAADNEEEPLSSLALPGLLTALAVIVGGWAVASIGDPLAEQTGLGSSFIGFTLVSLATSLPEVSTVFSAVRHNNYSTALSNIFGSNSFDVTLLFLVAVFSSEPGLTLQTHQTSALFAALGII